MIAIKSGFFFWRHPYHSASGPLNFQLFSLVWAGVGWTSPGGLPRPVVWGTLWLQRSWCCWARSRDLQCRKPCEGREAEETPGTQDEQKVRRAALAQVLCREQQDSTWWGFAGDLGAGSYSPWGLQGMRSEGSSLVWTLSVPCSRGT